MADKPTYEELEAKLETLQAEVTVLTSRATIAEAELEDANASLKAYKGAATKARRQAEALRLEKSPVARKIGPLKPDASDEAAADRQERIDAAMSAGEVQIVFSDGKKELTDLAPYSVPDGDAWQISPPRGRMLKPAILLEPGDLKHGDLKLRGFGLLDGSGEQIAWCGLPSPIEVKRFARVQIEQSIFF